MSSLLVWARVQNATTLASKPCTIPSQTSNVKNPEESCPQDLANASCSRPGNFQAKHRGSMRESTRSSSLATTNDSRIAAAASTHSGVLALGTTPPSHQLTGEKKDSYMA
uniref:Uncharacterized protein n=1 Tax=Plectus sambesii TaxID=2011161 RepID=A0A914X3C0_9BILA